MMIDNCRDDDILTVPQERLSLPPFAALLNQSSEIGKARLLSGMLESKIIVEYRREAWDLTWKGGARLTIDSHLTAYSSNSTASAVVKLCPEDFYVLEIKPTKRTQNLLRHLAELGVRSSGFSKLGRAIRVIEGKPGDHTNMHYKDRNAIRGIP